MPEYVSINGELIPRLRHEKNLRLAAEKVQKEVFVEEPFTPPIKKVVIVEKPKVVKPVVTSKRKVTPKKTTKRRK